MRARTSGFFAAATISRLISWDITRMTGRKYRLGVTGHGMPPQKIAVGSAGGTGVAGRQVPVYSMREILVELLNWKFPAAYSIT